MTTEKPSGPATAGDSEARVVRLGVVMKRAEKLDTAYMAFIAGGILALISGDGHIKTEGWTISFWALSLPPQVANFLLTVVVVQNKRSRSVLPEVIRWLGYGLSTVGTIGLLAHFSRYAAAGFAVLALCVVPVLGWLVIDEIKARLPDLEKKPSAAAPTAEEG